MDDKSKKDTCEDNKDVNSIFLKSISDWAEKEGYYQDAEELRKKLFENE